MKLRIQILTVLLAAPALYGAVGNVVVRGVTATQAILSYTAPDSAACTVEVSESPTYRPLVHDVDGALFSGGNLDSRAESFSSGRQRVFVTGKRRAEKGTNGHWYSRALQTVTAHYYRIACGSSVAAGSFITANMALGNTYNEPFPGDPNVASRPYYSTAGSYAWPEFINWDRNDPNARSESVIDPQTGMLLKRLAMPQDQPITYFPGYGDHPFTGMRSPDGAWSVTGATATFTGTGSNYLHLRDASLVIGNNGSSLYQPSLPMEYITLSLNAWCSGTCAGEDAKVQACLTLNGLNCWPSNATAKYQEAVLPTSATSAYVTLGSAVPILDAWTPAGFLPLNRTDLVARYGLANLDAAGVMTWVSGTYFSPNWTAGSRIYVANTECTLTSTAGLKRMTIDPASCTTPLTLPSSGTGFSGSNFGFLVRKKTSGTDTIKLQNSKYLTGSSLYMDWTASGSAKLCSETLTQNSVTGALGYHCLMISNLPMLYWIDRKTGDANYLGLFGAAGATGLDGFAPGSCDGTSTLNGTTPTAPENFYCSAIDNASKKIIVSCELFSTNQPGNSAVGCTNLTPGSQGKDFLSLIAQFTAGYTPSFDPALNGCGISGNQGSKLIVACGRSVQDTAAWIVVFDPKKVSTAPGCVGGGAPGCVVAAMTTYASPGARWCTLHTPFVSGKTDKVWIAGKYFAANSPAQVADGPYTSDIVSGALNATPTIAAGTGACPAGSAGCTQVTVDGEPCDAQPAGGEAAASPCPKNSAYVFLQNAAVGDVFQIEAELVILVAKAGNVWTLQRGYGFNAPQTHGSPTLNAFCNAHDFDHGSSEWSWTWDSAADPHALNLDGTTVLVAYAFDHPIPRPDATIGGLPSYATACPTGSCYGVRYNSSPMGDPPNRVVSMAPAFAGITGTASFVERAQDHPSRLLDSAPPSEKLSFVDGRPLTPLMDISDAAMPVSGSLYRLTSTTADGDNLRRVGYNIYVVKTASTTLVAGGNCSVSSPCTIWNDTTPAGSITQSCTITLSAGSGTVYVSQWSTGGLGVTGTSGLTLASNCPLAVGAGHPGGSLPMWSWPAASGAWAATGSDERYGTSAYFGIISRKIQPTWAYCGTQPLIDASSAATGDVLSDTAVDGYKYCVARKNGECRAASQVGDVYMNCPNASKRFDNTFGCGFNYEAADTPVDMCISNMSQYLNSIVQMGFKRNDFTGALGRSLTKGLGRYRFMDGFWHGKTLSDGSWILFRSYWTNGAWVEVLLGKMPPYPAEDSVVRSGFQAVPVKLAPPPALGVNNVVVQFGYAENGPSGGFFCTSRQEACLATTATVATIPFWFPSENPAGLPCANGCTVAVPAISQRMLYYQVKYRNAANQIIATGQVEVVAVP